MDLLGRRAAAMIALVSSFDYGFSSRRRDDRLELARRHCLQTAMLARQLAGCCGLQRHAEELFVAGMLHDIAGMLRPMGEGLWRCLGELPFDSALHSAELLSAWHLPHVIVDAVAELGRATDLNHAPDNESGRVLWVAHEFAGLVARQGEAPADLAIMQRLLDADVDVLSAALAGARRQYVESGRFCQ
jgi:HD-like signal output (HDOD) protein